MPSFIHKHSAQYSERLTVENTVGVDFIVITRCEKREGDKRFRHLESVAIPKALRIAVIKALGGVVHEPKK